MKKMMKTAAWTAIALSVATTQAALVGIDGATGGGVTYDYKINDTEVSYAEWSASPLGGGGTYSGALGTAAPAVDFSWHQAARYCNWLTSGNVNAGAYTINGSDLVTGMTDHDSAAMDSLVGVYGMVYVLPTQAEWKKAAYWNGSANTLYSNGSDVTAPTPESDAIYNRTNDGNPPSSTPWTVESGAFEQNGTKNMSGNVWEWQEDTDSGNSAKVTFNGGDWFLGETFIQETTDAADFRTGAYNIGMRVVAIPEPGTISLMGLSTVGLFATRTVRRRKTLGKSLLPVRRARSCDVFDSSDASVESVTEAGMELGEYFSAVLVDLKASVVKTHKGMSVSFWNHMVVERERRVARRMAARASFKKRSLETLDSFLSLILK